MDRRRILLVEDERDIADLVSLHLKDLCDELVVANDGHAGLELAMQQSWSLIILDIRLPGPSGLEICRRVRGGGNYQPILMLTSMSAELDRVLGLESGADDYLTKPFSVLELAARVRAIFRRMENLKDAEPTGATPGIRAGDIAIDPDRREVTLAGRPVALTAREFDLLCYFARHPGRVFRRADLLDKVWGYGHEGYEHTVNSHINRLRAKIEKDPSKPQTIVTVWGIGYKFTDPGNKLAAVAG
ncbi:MAG: response regulator transcription factor [Pseudomonadota bacterium]